MTTDKTLSAPPGIAAPGVNGAGETPAPGDAKPAVVSGAPKPAGSLLTAMTQRPTLRMISAGVTLIGIFLLGLVGYLYGLSGIQEARAQHTLYATFRLELGNLGSGTQIAPIAATTPGAPVALLNIPAIGIYKTVVVEGTSPENVALGPGHLRYTPLPGEFGVSVIFGRRATFGAPFGRLTQLKKGDKITTITGQGKATYVVMAKGDSTHVVEDPDPNRLLLFTACSAAVPSTYCYYDADLTSNPQQDPGGRPPVSSAELPLAGDSGVLVVTLIWGLALVIISAAGTIAAARWSPWLAYLAAAPLALAVLWNLYQSLAALLPNLY